MLIYCFIAFLFCCLTLFFLLYFFPFMCDFKIGILNMNGGRADFKRAALFRLFNLKKLNVLFLQETHSTDDIVSDWKRDFKGEVILSHNSSNSGGVGILLAQNFLPLSFTVEEIIPGFLLKVIAFLENVKLVFFKYLCSNKRIGENCIFRKAIRGFRKLS